MKPNKLNRREFLHESVLLAAAAGWASELGAHGQEKSGSGSPANRARVAVIGCGIRGKQHVQELSRLRDCEIVAVCDPDSERSAEAAALVAKQPGATAKTVGDMRRIFDDSSIDAVFIAAPNHWHALAAIWAMQAGKDVYVEKPVSHNISEGRRIVEVSRKTGRMCQGGTQNRSNMALAEAVRFMKAGELGEVKLARSIIYGGRGSIGGPGQFELPATLDYNLWAGPAPLSPLTRPKLHYDWHWAWETGNGELGNNNIHSLDICRWGLGLTGLGKSVLSYGGRFGYTDAGQTPNTQVVIFDFGDKTIVSETRGLKTAPFRPDFNGGWIFEGSKGLIAGTTLFDPEGKKVRSFEGKTESHFENFLQVVRSRRREDLHAEVLETHQSTALCHIGNISWRLGRSASPVEVREQLGKLKVHEDVQATLVRTEEHLRENKVDVEKTPWTLGAPLALAAGREDFVGSPQANAFLKRTYRAPFIVPDRA